MSQTAGNQEPIRLDAEGIRRRRDNSGHLDRDGWLSQLPNDSKQQAGGKETTPRAKSLVSLTECSRTLSVGVPGSTWLP